MNPLRLATTLALLLLPLSLACGDKDDNFSVGDDTGGGDGGGDGGTGDGGTGDGGTGDGGGDGGTGDGGGGDGGTVDTLEAGAWALDRGAVSSDPCGLDSGGASETRYVELTYTATGEIEFLEGPSDEVAYSCAVSGSSFTCDAIELSEEVSATATITSSEVLAASWDDPGAFEGTITNDVTCDGSGCGELGISFPCTLVYGATGERVD